MTLRRLRSHFDEPYRIRRGFGLSPLRSKRELRALVDFCREQLQEEHIDLNPDRKLIFETTIRLYENPGAVTIRTNVGLTKAYEYSDVHEFIRDHVGWYWS